MADDDRADRRWLAPVAIALVTALCRLPSFLRPMSDSDEAIYASVAALVNKGGVLYLDGGVDMKCPGIFWTYAAVFRVAGQYAMGALHLVTLLVVLATAAVLGVGAARVAGGDAGRRAGLLAALFYGVFSSVFYPQMLAANTEVFMMLPLCAAAVLLLRRPFSDARPSEIFLASALVGIACAWKQVALVNGILILIVALVSSRRVVNCLASLVGVLLGLGAWLASVWHWADLAGMWHWAFVRVATHYGPDAWYPARYAENLGKTGALFLVSTTPLWIAVIARLTSPRGSSPRERYLLAWCALSCLAVASGGHFFGHYYLQLIGPLCLLSGVQWAEPWPKVRAPVAAATAISGLAFFVVAIFYDPIELGFHRGPAVYTQAADYVRAHTQPEDRIFAWGYAAPIYLAADRLPATRFVGLLRGIDRAAHEPPDSGWDCGPEVWPLLLDDFAAHPPALIVDTAPADLASYRGYPITLFPTIAKYLHDGYTREATVAGVDIYRRR